MAMQISPVRPVSAPPRRILDAAVTVFGRYGFRRASMEEVASGAGLSRQGLYRYFATKEALFVAVVEDVHRGAEAASVTAMEAAATAGADATGVLCALLGTRLEFYTSGVLTSPHAAELMEESNRLGGALTQESTRIFRDMLVKAIETEQKRKRLKLKRGFPAGTLADLLITATAGIKYAVPPPPLAQMRRTVGTLVGLIVTGASA